MDLAGTCGTRSLKELYEADRKDIETQVPPAAITVSRLDRGSYALSWRIGDRIHYGKMWTARADAARAQQDTAQQGMSQQDMAQRDVSALHGAARQVLA